MSKIIVAALSGMTLYAVLRDLDARPYNTGGSAFETLDTSHWSSYAVSLTDDGSGYFAASFPSGVTQGRYVLDVRNQGGVTPDPTDTAFDMRYVEWSGSAVVSLSDVAISAAAAKTAAESVDGKLTTGRAAKIDNLDATITSRLADADYTAPDNAGIAAIQSKTDNLPADPASASATATAISVSQTAITTAVGTVGTAVAGVQTTADAIQAKTDNLPADPASDSATDAAITSAETAITSAVSGVQTAVNAVKAKTDNLPSQPAAVGSAMTLTSGERNSVATALLDLTNGVETGITVRQALRFTGASAAGKISGANTSTVTVLGLDGATTRLVVTTDANGNRSAITYSG